MYADFTVPVPEQKGKISRQNSGGRIYIHYILDRTYNPELPRCCDSQEFGRHFFELRP